MAITKEQIERLKTLTTDHAEFKGVMVNVSDLSALISAWQAIQPRHASEAKNGEHGYGFVKGYTPAPMERSIYNGRRCWRNVYGDLIHPTGEPTHFIPLSALPKPESE